MADARARAHLEGEVGDGHYGGGDEAHGEQVGGRALLASEHHRNRLHGRDDEEPAQNLESVGGDESVAAGAAPFPQVVELGDVARIDDVLRATEHFTLGAVANEEADACYAQA